MTMIIAHPPMSPETAVMTIARGPVLSVNRSSRLGLMLTSNVSVRALFRQVERCVVSTHGPYRSQESHDGRPTYWPLGAILERCPNLA